MLFDVATVCCSVYIYAHTEYIVYIVVSEIVFCEMPVLKLILLLLHAFRLQIVIDFEFELQRF